MIAPHDLQALAREIASNVTGVGPSRVDQAAREIVDALTRILTCQVLSTREAILFRLLDESLARVKALEEALLLLRLRDDNDTSGDPEATLADCWCPAQKQRGRAIKDHEHTAECCIARAAIAKAEGR